MSGKKVQWGPGFLVTFRISINEHFSYVLQQQMPENGPFPQKAYEDLINHNQVVLFITASSFEEEIS